MISSILPRANPHPPTNTAKKSKEYNQSWIWINSLDSEEVLPLVWKTSPLPRSEPKRPVGHPCERLLESEDITSSAKPVCLEDTINSTCILDITTSETSSCASNSSETQSDITPSASNSSESQLDITSGPSSDSSSSETQSDITPSASNSSETQSDITSGPSSDSSSSETQSDITPSASNSSIETQSDITSGPSSDSSSSETQSDITPSASNSSIETQSDITSGPSSDSSSSETQSDITPSASNSSIETQSDITSGPSSDSNTSGNYKHFTLRQKLKGQEFAELRGICVAAKHSKIPRSTVNTMVKTGFHKWSSWLERCTTEVR